MQYEKKFKYFVLLWGTQSLSKLGSSLTPFALVLWSYSLTGSALASAMLTVSTYVPYILLSLPVGAFTDKMDKKMLMLIADSVAALCTLSVLVLYLRGSLELWHIYLLNAVTGAMQTIQEPSSEVATTLITPEDRYQKAGALKAFSYSLINMASPVIATALYSIGGLSAVILVDLSTFLLAFLSLIFFVRIPKQEKGKENISVLANLKEGLFFLWKNRGVLEVILFLGAINFIASIYNAALPAMVLSFESEGILALINFVAGFAMILSSVISTLLPAPKSRVSVIITSLFISMSTENFLLSFSRCPYIWALGAFLGWMCIPIMNTNLDALMRSSIPSEIQGRVYSARNMLQFFTIPLGYLAGGVLVDSVFEPFMASTDNSLLLFLFGEEKGSGAAFLFAVIGVLGVLVCLIFSRMKALRELD